MTEVTNGPVQSEVRHCPEGSLCIPMRGSWEEWMDKDSGEGTTPSPRKDLQEAQKSVVEAAALCPGRIYGLHLWAPFSLALNSRGH